MLFHGLGQVILDVVKAPWIELISHIDSESDSEALLGSDTEDLDLMRRLRRGVSRENPVAHVEKLRVLEQRFDEMYSRI